MYFAWKKTNGTSKVQSTPWHPRCTPGPESHIEPGDTYMLLRRHLPLPCPPPPHLGKKNDITYPYISWVLVTIGNYKNKTKISGNCPETTPPPPKKKNIPISRENGNMHAAPLVCIRVGAVLFLLFLRLYESCFLSLLLCRLVLFYSPI